MALKHKITKAAFDKLSDELKGEYVEDADKKGGYTLDVEGLPEPENDGALKRAKDREKIRADEAEAEAERLDTELTALKGNQGKGEKDIARLTKAHEKTIADMTADHEAKVGKLTKFIDKEIKGGKAEALATKISTVPKLLAGEIGKRLSVNYDGDEPALEILGADGKPDSKLTLDKLGEEFVANKDFSSIMIGSKARGSGAAPNNIPGSGGSAIPGDKPLDLASAPTNDLLAHVRSVQANKAANGQ